MSEARKTGSQLRAACLKAAYTYGPLGKDDDAIAQVLHINTDLEEFRLYRRRRRSEAPRMRETTALPEKM